MKIKRSTLGKAMEFVEFAEFVNKINGSQIEIVEDLLEFVNKKQKQQNANSNQNQDKFQSSSLYLQANSTNSANSNGLTWQNEDYFETYEERAGIYQYDAGLNQLEAEKKAFKDIKQDFLGQHNLNENSSEFKSFLAGFNDYINKTIQ
jgi:alanine racemase